MLINFLNRTSRTFTGRDALDVFTKEYIDTLNEQYIKKENVAYTLYSCDKPKVSVIGSHRKKKGIWSMIIDDDNKILIVNPKNVITELNSYYYFIEEPVCVDYIDEYQVINVISILKEINKLRLELEKQFISDNKDDILKKCEELLSKEDYSLSSAKTSGIRHKYIECFFADEVPELPEILGEIKLNESDFSNVDSIFKYIFNKDLFKKEILENITTSLKCNSSKYADIYIYFHATELLSTEIPKEDLLFKKRIVDAIKNSGQTLNIITTDGRKIKVENHFEERRYFISCVGCEYINAENIQTIIFGKNILFQR